MAGDYRCIHSICKWLILFSLASLATGAAARSVLLNGIDISSARNQELENVNIKIDRLGNVLIDAPHYQINEEETFVPLSKFVQSEAKKPVHKPMMAIQKPRRKEAEERPVDDDTPAKKVIKKPRANPPEAAPAAPAETTYVEEEEEPEEEILPTEDDAIQAAAVEKPIADDEP